MPFKTALLPILLAAFFSATAPAEARKHVIISDIDDTVKHTDVDDKSDALGNALFNRTGFSGMAPLYSGLRLSDGDPTVRTGPSDLIFVSGSPAIFEGAIEEFLNLNGYALWSLFTRGLSNWAGTREFKLRTIRDLLRGLAARETEVYLVGDDTQKDPVVYRTIAQEFPELIHGVYIREVLRENSPIDGQLGFHSAADVGLELFLRGRLTEHDIYRILDDFYRPESGEFDAERAFPDFAECPWIPDWLTRTWGREILRQGYVNLTKRIRTFEQDVEIACTYR